MHGIRNRLGVMAALVAATATVALFGAPSTAQAATAASSNAPPAGSPAAGAPTIGLASAADLSAAATERELWYGHWRPGAKCSGDVCTITSTDDLPHFWISGQNFNKGKIYVGIFHLDGTPIISTTIESGSWQGYVSYAWGWKANAIDCAAIGAPVTNNSFLQAKDLTNNQWSNYIYVTTGCAVL